MATSSSLLSVISRVHQQETRRLLIPAAVSGASLGQKMPICQVGPLFFASCMLSKCNPLLQNFQRFSMNIWLLLMYAGQTKREWHLLH